MKLNVFEKKGRILSYNLAFFPFFVCCKVVRSNMKTDFLFMSIPLIELMRTELTTAGRNAYEALRVWRG